MDVVDCKDLRFHALCARMYYGNFPNVKQLHSQAL